jgi:hypothetical protein
MIEGAPDPVAPFSHAVETRQVAARVFLTHFGEDYERMNAEYATCFAPGRRPARST